MKTTPQSFIATPFDKEEANNLEAAELVIVRLEGKENLSVQQRQELWLAKKNLKVAKAQCCIAKEEMTQIARSAPDLSRSRQSFRASKKDAEKLPTNGCQSFLALNKHSGKRPIDPKLMTTKRSKR